MRAAAFLAVVLIFSAAALAQTVSHQAKQIRPGIFGADFGGGNFTFNNSLVVVDKLGIGTTSPVGLLHVAIATTPSNITATGGTITHSSGYTIHTFTTNGTFTVSGTGNVQVLVVAGGGGGSNVGSGGGGGGGGGVVYNATFPVTSQAYTITVGAGGAAAQNGSNSIFSTITAIGGGAGGAYNTNGSNGGCGGGAGRDGGSKSGGIGSQGYNGGKGGADTWGSAGGGGGAGAAGHDGGVDSATQSGTYSQGGDGATYNISGSPVTYAGGGGGDWQTGIVQANGGAGGGGKGAANLGAVLPTAGTANTGGGGGGGHGNAGAGGSGIVIIRYTTAFDSLVVASSGNVGIGTQSPANTLNVVGDANVTGSLYVGVGTASPTNAKLDVNAATYIGNSAGKAYIISTDGGVSNYLGVNAYVDNLLGNWVKPAAAVSVVAGPSAGGFGVYASPGTTPGPISDWVGLFSVSSTGIVSMGYEQITGLCSNAAYCSASCTGSKKPLGVLCGCSNAYIRFNMGITSGAGVCYFESTCTGSATAIVTCANIA